MFQYSKSYNQQQERTTWKYLVKVFFQQKQCMNIYSIYDEEILFYKTSGCYMHIYRPAVPQQFDYTELMILKYGTCSHFFYGFGSVMMHDASLLNFRIF